MRSGAYQTYVRSGKEHRLRGVESVWAGRPRSLTAGYERHEHRKEDKKQRHHRDAAEDMDGEHLTEHHTEKQEHEGAYKKPPRETS
jgi:hypothetical protein